MKVLHLTQTRHNLFWVQAFEAFELKLFQSEFEFLYDGCKEHESNKVFVAEKYVMNRKSYGLLIALLVLGLSGCESTLEHSDDDVGVVDTADTGGELDASQGGEDADADATSETDDVDQGDDVDAVGDATEFDAGDANESEPDADPGPDADADAAGPDEPEPCPDLSHSLSRDSRQSYNLGNNANYPASSTEMKWVDDPEGEISQNMAVLVDHYAALEFTTGGPVVGSTQFEDSSLVTQPGNTVLAISECPGQFVDLPQWCVASNYLPGLFWTVGHPDEDYPFSCALEPDTTYYLNIAHRESSTDLDASRCSDATECGSIFIHRRTSD